MCILDVLVFRHSKDDKAIRQDALREVEQFKSGFVAAPFVEVPLQSTRTSSDQSHQTFAPKTKSFLSEQKYTQILQMSLSRAMLGMPDVQTPVLMLFAALFLTRALVPYKEPSDTMNQT